MRHYECDSCKACDFSRGLFTAIELVGDIGHLAQTVSCHVDVAERLFEHR